MPDERNYYDDRQYQDEYFEQQYSPPPPSPPPPPQLSVRIWSKWLPHWINSKSWHSNNPNNFTRKSNAPHQGAKEVAMISLKWKIRHGQKILWDPTQS